MKNSMRPWRSAKDSLFAGLPRGGRTPVQRAMRHSSPETKRRYQLGMAEQVRQAVKKVNQRL